MNKTRLYPSLFNLKCCIVCALATLLILTGGASSASAGDEDNIALLDRSAKAFASVVKKAAPAVVHVGVEKSVSAGAPGQNPFDFFNDPFFEHFFGPQFRSPRQAPQQRKQQAAGSGFIISKDGYILTNNHVVSEADSITVRLADDREFKAEVVGTDPQSDVALIKIDGNNLPVLPLGDSDKLEVGEWVIAIGSPFELNQTVTVGVVSAKGRSRIGINDYENFIQTDAAINPGNSGGPLLNIHGEAIGLNTAIFSRSGGYMGIGFAIPINMAKAVEQQLQKHGKVTRGWLGVVIQDITDDLAQSFQLKSKAGVLIGGVADNSPAADAGLEQGDVIIGLNGRPVDDVPDLRNRIALIAPGATASMDVIRSGKRKIIKVKIGEQPTDMQAHMQGVDSVLGNMGLSLQDLTPELARQFGYAKDQGVLISDVAPDSSASQAGLQAGQLIEEVDKQRVRGVADIKQILKRSQNPGQVLLRIRVDAYSRYVVLKAQ